MGIFHLKLNTFSPWCCHKPESWCVRVHIIGQMSLMSKLMRCFFMENRKRDTLII